MLLYSKLSLKVKQSASFGSSTGMHSHETEDAETLSWVIENESRAGRLTDTFQVVNFMCSYWYPTS